MPGTRTSSAKRSMAHAGSDPLAIGRAPDVIGNEQRQDRVQSAAEGAPHDPQVTKQPPVRASFHGAAVVS